MHEWIKINDMKNTGHLWHIQRWNQGRHWYSVLFDRVDNFLTQDNLHHTLTLLVSCLTQTKHRKEQGLHIKNAQLSLSCVILRPRSNGKLDHNKNQKTSKKHLQPPAQQSSEALFQRRAEAGCSTGCSFFLFQSSSNKLQINAMHIPLNSLVRILRIKHIAHLQSNRRLKSFQVSSICIFQHLRLWDLFNSQAYISPHETHEMYLVGIVLQRHKGIPLAQYHGARTVHWTVPDEHVAVAQNTPSAHIQDLCSTVLFPGAKGKKKRQCFL